MRAIQCACIPTWRGLKYFQKSLCPCTLDKGSLNLGMVKDLGGFRQPGRKYTELLEKKHVQQLSVKHFKNIDQLFTCVSDASHLKDVN